MRWYTSLTVLLLFVLYSSSSVQSMKWFPPFNNSTKLHHLCNNEMDNIIVRQTDPLLIDFYLESYTLCYQDFEQFVPIKYQFLVWFMRGLKFCQVNQIFQYNKHTTLYHRNFQKTFLRYAYVLVCDKGRHLPDSEQYNLFVYANLFNILYETRNTERQIICDRVSLVYSDLYSRCYVPHVAIRQRKINERCSSSSSPLIQFLTLFMRFSRKCDSFTDFLLSQQKSPGRLGDALSQDTVFMNLMSANLVSNIHSDSELPSLVLKTRLMLQHFSLAAVKLWKQIEVFKKCRQQVHLANVDTFANDTDDERARRLPILVSNTCCENNHVCDLQSERRYKKLADDAWLGFQVELILLGLVFINTILIALLLIKTRRSLSTATVLFVFNILFSNLLFLVSFGFFFVDLFSDEPYGAVNEDHVDKPEELVVAETLQTHLFASEEFRKHLIQETLYSLAQNGSLIGLIHLLVLVLVVINRSMAGAAVHISRVAVVSLFAGVWMFLITTHITFSTMQISAIQNLDQLFATLAKGRIYLQCGREARSGYEEIAEHCDRTAVFHAFGAYLLRGHTMFTLFFLTASIIIFTFTITYHMKVRKEYDNIRGVRDQSPHRRRERLFHTLVLSIATFFISILGQTYIEIAVFWVDDRADVAALTKWYHLARIAAFVDPLLNPLIVVARTPALRRQLRSQWTSLRSKASSKGISTNSVRKIIRQRSSVRKRETEIRLNRTDRPSSAIARSSSTRRSQDSQTHNSIV